MKSEKVCVAGLGVIGLPFAGLLAKTGHQVVGCDIDEAKIARLQAGVIEAEPEVQGLVSEAIASGNLSFSVKPSAAAIYLVCTPTPLKNGEKVADLSMLNSAIQAVSEVCGNEALVIIESTIPPGTTNQIQESIFRESNVSVAHAPERLLPGNVIAELLQNERLIGCDNPRARSAASALYATFANGEIHETDATTAETVKLLENTYRDVNVALANELADACLELGVNPDEAFQLANRHPRVNILKPGIGVGGHCLPVDPYFLVQRTTNMQLVPVAREINERRPTLVAKRIRDLAGRLGADRIVLFGRSYKEGVWDPRESSALEIQHILTDLNTVAWDPLEPKSAAPDPKAGDLLVGLVNHSAWPDAQNLWTEAGLSTSAAFSGNPA